MTKALMIHPVLAITVVLSAPWATASPDLDQLEACAATASPDPAAALLQVERQQLKVHMESNSSKATANSSASESTSQSMSSKRATQNDAKQPMSSQLDSLERRVEALEGRRHDHGKESRPRRGGHSRHHGGHRPHWDGVAPRPDWNGLEDKPDPDDPKRILPGVRATREEGQGVVTGDKYKGDDPYEIMMDVDYIIDSNPKRPKGKPKMPKKKGKGKPSKGKGSPTRSRGKGAPTNRGKKSSTRGKHGPKPSSRGKTSDKSPKKGGKSFIEAPRSQSFIEEPKIW